MFSKRYETEQQELKAKIPELEAYLTTETDKTENLQKFIAKVTKVTNPTELTPELVNEYRKDSRIITTLSRRQTISDDRNPLQRRRHHQYPNAR